MRLIVTGYGAETVRYRFLWGMYVTGIRPWLHCQRCLKGSQEKRVSARMENGATPLERASGLGFLTLHGYAPGPGQERGQKNLHLAVPPKAGARAEAMSVYGPVFMVEDAEEIAIRGPVLGEGSRRNMPGVRTFGLGGRYMWRR